MQLLPLNDQERVSYQAKANDHLLINISIFKIHKDDPNDIIVSHEPNINVIPLSSLFLFHLPYFLLCFRLF